MKFLLRAKAWQLFVLWLILPIILDILITDESIFQDFAGLLLPITYFGWLFSVGIELSRKNACNYPYLNINYFKKGFIICIASVIILRFFPYLDYKNDMEFTLLSIAFVLLQLGVVIPVFYLLFFVSKALNGFNVNREATFIEIKREFFRILIFPIGIWIVQPMINKL
jgi:hypothetical protein